LVCQYNKYLLEDHKQLGEDYEKGAHLMLKYAKKHFDIIEKFGRYPHRNDVLGRESTPEELEYLKNAETFGQ